jgi:hypothetical protein
MRSAQRTTHEARIYAGKLEKNVALVERADRTDATDSEYRADDQERRRFVFSSDAALLANTIPTQACRGLQRVRSPSQVAAGRSGSDPSQPWAPSRSTWKKSRSTVALMFSTT